MVAEHGVEWSKVLHSNVHAPQVALVLLLFERGHDLKEEVTVFGKKVLSLAVTQVVHKGCEWGPHCCTCIEPAAGALANNEVDGIPLGMKISKGKGKQEGGHSRLCVRQ